MSNKLQIEVPWPLNSVEKNKRQDDSTVIFRLFQHIQSNDEFIIRSKILLFNLECLLFSRNIQFIQSLLLTLFNENISSQQITVTPTFNYGKLFINIKKVPESPITAIFLLASNFCASFVENQWEAIKIITYGMAKQRKKDWYLSFRDSHC